MDEKTRLELEAATPRHLVEHSQAHTEVRSIDVMELGRFFTETVSQSGSSGAEEQGERLSHEQARKLSIRDASSGFIFAGP